MEVAVFFFGSVGPDQRLSGSRKYRIFGIALTNTVVFVYESQKNVFLKTTFVIIRTSGTGAQQLFGRIIYKQTNI